MDAITVGVSISCSIGLKDDRTETFLNAIKSKMRDNTQIVSNSVEWCEEH